MNTIRKTILAFVALLITVSLSAQESKKAENLNQQTIKLTNHTDTLQYAIGAFMGQWMVKNDFKVQNANVFLRGMDDILQNRSLAIADSSITPLILAYQLSIQNKRNQQLEQNLFTTLKGKTGIGVLPNGVNYIIQKQGEGIRPGLKDTLEINAIGVFPDGTLFEDTYKKKQTIITLTETLIPGLKEAIQLMPEGSTWRIFIPSELAYGAKGLINIIPPNTALIYDIELMKVSR